MWAETESPPKADTDTKNISLKSIHSNNLLKNKKPEPKSGLFFNVGKDGISAKGGSASG